VGNPAGRRDGSSDSGSRLRPLLLAAIALACLLIVLAAALMAHNDRQRRLDSAQQELAAMTRLLAGHVQGALLGADLALQGVVERVETSDLRSHDPAAEATLRRSLRSLPMVRALFVVGPDGFITQDSDPTTPRRNLADRDYFRAHLQPGGRDLFVSRPWISRSTGTWFVGVSRRIEGPDARFRGVAVAALETRFLERTYRDLDLGDPDVIGVLSRDGMVVARHPSAEGVVGNPLAAEARTALLAALGAAPAGTFEARGSSGQTRLFAYRSVPQSSLVVLVGRAQEAVLASWRRTVAVVAAVTVVALALGALLCGLLISEARRSARQAAHRAEAERLEALGLLTGGVAHDFNNLLQSLSASLSLLGKTAGTDRRTEVVLEQGLASIERGRALVAQLLGVARRQEIEVRPVDINCLISGMESLVRNAAAPAAEVELQLAPGLPLCLADPSRLDAAILNLVINARDAVDGDPDRPGRVRLSTHLCDGLPPGGRRRARTGAFVCLTVSDNGRGMEADVRRRAMEPFFTTKGDAGTGLGLSQVRTFVHESDGEIEIASEPGSGTTIRLYLPCPGTAPSR